MLIVGFLTLLVTTFLKFTGRGDLAPLVVFVGGGIILYEVIGLFNAIYKAIATFLQV
nr:SpoIIIAC/SpoIIIAD family protein [Ammoniphilus resinae]